MVLLLISIMAMGIGENIRTSFDFAKGGLVGHWGRWLGLIILCIIPIVNFIFPLGYCVRIYNGGDEAPELDDWLRLFVDGLQLFLINIVYMIVPFFLIVTGIVTLIFGMVGGIVLTRIDFDFSGMFLAFFAMIGLILLLVGVILAIACCLISTMGCIRFARMDSLGEAFNFSEITAKITEIGWGSYILAYLVLVIITSLIVGILAVIPVVGWLLTFIIIPLFLIWQAKYFENIYSLG